MRVGLIGGAVFVGRAMVEEALGRGHEVVALSRGVSGKPPADVTWIRGDREADQDLAALASEGPFDAIVDTSGFVPSVVGASARALRDATGRYVFVSSLSVYADGLGGADESSPVFECPPDAGPEDGDYGTLKAGCERAAIEVFDDRAVLVRAGLILGPRENIGRLPWWLRRVERGGEVLAPGRPGRPIQYVDARDLAAWIVDACCASDGPSGPINAVSPPASSTMGELLEGCVEATGSDARLVWLDDAFLLEHDAGPWHELPLWVPENDEWAGFYEARADRAAETGLSFRPARRTVDGTWAWLADGGDPQPRPGLSLPGMDPEKERAILDAWHVERLEP
jgi:2'-hydroxyisoflavone reductase